MCAEDYIKDKIKKYTALGVDVDQLVESAEPIYSGNSPEPVEYVVPAEEFQAVFNRLVAVKQGVKKNNKERI